ncbi:MAG: GH92 family glycosyl hydrolase [Cryomorphaceae bacterium]|nr:GH92 family glycosyl hydrolase [Cryomorphaceae bacterium]
MTKHLLLGAFTGLSLAAFSQISVNHIDPFIGTGGHGHTHPAATAPFGMVQIGPDTRREGWDGCSGYHFTDSTVWGFSHTHLSGTGVGDYGDFLFKPWGGPFADSPVAFDKSSERASAGTYSVRLTNGTQAEFTAAERGGFHRYQYAEDQAPELWIDLNYRDRVLRASARLEGSVLHLKRVSQGWAKEQHAYLAVLVPAVAVVDIVDSLHVRISLPSRSIELAVGFSGTDSQGAQRNLRATLASSRNFEGCAARSAALWQAELDRAQVAGGSAAQKLIYATALYHAFSVPNLWSDADGRYRGMDGRIHSDADHAHYTVFSLWDTYRTAHPLYALIQPERTRDFITTMLDHFDQSGRLPVWELAANETDCMIAYHSVSVLADAQAKGYEMDSERLLKAMVATAQTPVFGIPIYRTNGYLSIQDESESVSKTLEYSYDDATIAWTAARLGRGDVAEQFWRRSQGWVSLLDPETGLMRPRDNGDFMQRFEPREVNSHYTEANAWQYSFAPVHDLARWQRMLAAQGRSLEGQLDALFAAPSATVGREQADITGLIGQYAHGNEPSHHIAWLYAATERPDKGQDRIREILETMYSDQPDGYQGNEDCGQMSAWYVMSSWGIYPLVPGEARYALGAMHWDRVELRATGLHTDLKRVGSGALFKGYEHSSNPRQLLSQSFLDHDDLIQSQSLAMHHAESASKLSPYRNVEHYIVGEIRPAPRIRVARRFETETTAWIDGVEETLSESRRLERGDGLTQHRSVALSTKKPNDWTAKITSGNPNPQYNPGSASIVDGVFGDVDWRKGEWTGVQGEDLVVDLRSSTKRAGKEIEVEIGLLKDIKSWIALPSSIEVVAHFANGQSSTGRIDLQSRALSEEPSTILRSLVVLKSRKKSELTSVIIRLVNPGSMPEWHPGKGGASFIFLDEITLRVH